MENFEHVKKEGNLPEEFEQGEIFKYQEFIKQTYIESFSEKNFSVHESIDLVAGKTDSSILFIGSTISALKPLYMNNEIPPNGVVINQPCIRTHNLKNIYSEQSNKGNTFFNLMGGMSEADRFSDIYKLSLQYFIESLNINRDRLFIRATSEDKDILENLKSEKDHPELELDGRQPDYYRWRYGIKGVSGRGIALAIRNAVNQKESMTLGNIIIMESDDHPKTVQWGYGVESIISGIYNKDRAIEGSLISQVVPYEIGLKSKFADALAAVIEMYNSGLKPNNRGAASYLKAYLRGMSYLINKLNIEKNTLKEYVSEYCKLRK